MTTRAEEIAAEGPYTRVSVPVTDAMMDISAWFKDWGTDIKPPDKGTKAEAVASLRDLMTAILNRAYKQGQQDRWIPVSKRLPEPNIEVLVAFENDTVAGTSQWTRVKSPDIMGWLGPAENKGKVITHWMPLPSPPNPEQP